MVLKQFEMAAAGHDGTLTNEEGSLFFKPTVCKEVGFYQALDSQRKKYINSDDTASDLDGVMFFQWTPWYLGSMEQGIDGGETQYLNYDEISPEMRSLQSEIQSDKSYIVLENVLHGYTSPNVLDIKLGKVLFDCDATEEKKARLEKVSNCTTSGILGARICGMKVKACKPLLGIECEHFQLDPSCTYYSINKHYGRSLKSHRDMIDAFHFFFDMNNISNRRREKIVDSFLTRLQLLYNTLLDTPVRLISSSLLFIYETDVNRWDAQNDEDEIIDDDFAFDEDEEDATTSSKSLSKLKLIDFAHSEFKKEEQGHDENIIYGVESLIDVFKELQR